MDYTEYVRGSLGLCNSVSWIASWKLVNQVPSHLLSEEGLKHVRKMLSAAYPFVAESLI
ncbi:Uncharacterised protein [Mycobacteroides abscessus subsp. bolletii]|nr:Uncharacterised protein [Mycobacteroides abscessus subsp. bolletii]